MEKANITLYTVIGNPERIAAAIQDKYKEMTQEITSENGNIALTLADDTVINFAISHQQDKPDFIASHTAGMANYFASAETQLVELKESVLRQIRVFNCVTGITFEIDDNEDRTNYIINCIYAIANDVNGFLLYPNMQIYTKEGKLLFSIQGESQLTEFIPIGNADLLDMNRPEEAPADTERRLRSIAQLKAKNIPYLEHLLSAALESEAKLRSREEKVKRAAALFTVAVYSEVMLSENSSRENALSYFNKMDQLYGVRSYITPKEAEYINNPEPEKQECIQFVWRYECCGVLLWAADVVDDLSYPSEIIDVPVLAAIFWQHKGIKDLLSKGFARSEAEILDTADITLRYDWACVDARIHGKEAPASLDSGIVVERHYAFNWIIGANEGANWDDVLTTT
ncbi:MAG: DUF4272 domain-containing protein [Parabacteroides sp.]|nr:DUF4272 domain-containing protein [Parabacteroides sp.]